MCRCLLRPKYGVESMELELQAVVVTWCGCWELNPSLLQEQQVFLTAEYLSSPLTFLLCRQIGANQRLQGVQGIFLSFFSQTPPQNTGGIITIYPDFFSPYNHQGSNSHFLKPCSISQQHSWVSQGSEPTFTGTLTLIRRNSCIYTLGSGTVLCEGWCMSPAS